MGGYALFTVFWYWVVICNFKFTAAMRSLGATFEALHSDGVQKLSHQEFAPAQNTSVVVAQPDWKVQLKMMNRIGGWSNGSSGRFNDLSHALPMIEDAIPKAIAESHAHTDHQRIQAFVQGEEKQLQWPWSYDEDEEEEEEEEEEEDEEGG